MDCEEAEEKTRAEEHRDAREERKDERGKSGKNAGMRGKNGRQSGRIRLFRNRKTGERKRSLHCSRGISCSSSKNV